MTTTEIARPRRAMWTLAVLAALAVGALAFAQLPTLADDDDHDHGAPEVEFLTDRATSPDDIRAQLRLRLDGTGPTNVMNMHDVDHLLLLKLTFAPGDVVDWHTHPGPVIVIVDEGVLTVTSESDCVARDYGPDEVYIEQGPADALRVENLPDATDDTVIYALFFQLPEEGPVTLFEEEPLC